MFGSENVVVLVVTGRLLTTSEQRRSDRVAFVNLEGIEADVPKNECRAFAYESGMLQVRSAHDVRPGVERLVSEKRRAWSAVTAGEARPTGVAQYMYTDNGSVIRAVFVLC